MHRISKGVCKKRGQARDYSIHVAIKIQTVHGRMNVVRVVGKNKVLKKL